MQKANSAKVFQVVVSVTVLVVAAVLTRDKKVLSRLVSEVNDSLTANGTTPEQLVGDIVGSLLNQTVSTPESTSSDSNDSGDLNIDPLWKPIAVALSSGSFTTGGNSLLAYAFRLIKKLPSSFAATESTGFVQSLHLGKRQLGYFASLAGSELTGVVLWFAAFIYQAAQIGNVNCDDIESLLKNYNLTGDSINKQILSNFYGIDSWSNATQLVSSGQNLTTLQTQSSLLIKLAGNCKTQKASIALTCVGFFTYLVTGSMLGASGYTLYSKYKALQQKNNEHQSVSVNFDNAFSFPSLSLTKHESEKEEV